MKINGDLIVEGTDYQLKDINQDKPLDMVKIAYVINENKEVDLPEGVKISDYKYIWTWSGYGYTKTNSFMPTSWFISHSSWQNCYSYIKTYQGTGFTSIQYVSDTKIKVNGAAGVDVIIEVFLIK